MIFALRCCTKEVAKTKPVGADFKSYHLYTIFTKGNIAIIPRSDIPANEIPSFENLLRQK
jgi:hypothetical protein